MGFIIGLNVIANFWIVEKKPKRIKMNQIKESLISKDIEFDLNSNKLTLVSLLEKQLTTEIMANNIIFSFIPLTCK
jgi:hypothetical protein